MDVAEVSACDRVDNGNGLGGPIPPRMIIQVRGQPLRIRYCDIFAEAMKLRDEIGSVAAAAQSRIMELPRDEPAIGEPIKFREWT
jgi:hypothetical protein